VEKVKSAANVPNWTFVRVRNQTKRITHLNLLRQRFSKSQQPCILASLHRSRGGPIPFAVDDLAALEGLSSREQATRVYGLLRMFLDIPVEARTEALARLTTAIENRPDRDAVHSALREFWSHHSYVRVISEAGLPNEAFLLRELLARALRHLLPVDEVEGDLYVLMDSLDLNESDARWLGSLPDSLVASWADIFRPSRSSILASCKILALRAANLGLSRDLIEFADDEDITKSSFFNLPSVVEHVVRHPEDFQRWEEQRAACDTQLQSVNRLLEEKGSSADLVFRVRLLRSLLARIHQVISLQQAGSDSSKLSIVIVHGFASQRRIRTVLSASTRRLARSVVERTGRTGKHYIARNAAQWRAMGQGAILAGVITSFTALFKYSLAWAIHAPMLLAFALSMNYVVSFLLMQAGGFLLASKMPAATAATLVDAMEDPAKDHMASLKQISETQFIVTISNLVGAVPVSILIDRIIMAATGHPFLNPEQADHGVHMLFPHSSMTIIFAIPAYHGHSNLQQSSHSTPAWIKAGRDARELGGASCSWICWIHRSRIPARRCPRDLRAVRHPSRSSPRYPRRRKSRLCSRRRPRLRTIALA
jgi:site-specific recombinase